MKTFISVCWLLFLFTQISAQSADSSRYFFLRGTEEQSGRLYMQAYQDYKRSLEFDSKNTDLLRQLGVSDDAEHVNPNGGAIALGHPLGMSGTRLAITATHHMVKNGLKRALATMCVGVGQGVSLAIERV